jgi:PAS domain S-box-containing protein
LLIKDTLQFEKGCLNTDSFVNETREKFKYLFEHSLDLIYVHDLKGIFLDANELTLITLGYERSEISNISLTKLLKEEDLSKARELTKELVQTGKQLTRIEYEVRCKSGDHIFIETYGIPLIKNGKVYAILGIGKNITDRKLKEERLKESGEMFKAIYKEGLLPAYTWRKVNDDLILIDYNNAAIQFSKGEVKNQIGYKASEVYKNNREILEAMHSCLAEQKHTIKESKLYLENLHGEKDLSIKYSFVNKEVLVIQLEDITDRKDAVLKLIASETKYKEMINNLDVGFYQVSIDGRMISHNSAHNIILGYDPHESLVGKKVQMFWQYPELRDEYLKEMYREGFTRNYICHAKKKDGKKIIVELNSHLIEDEDGNPIRIDGTFIDVTEKFILEEKLKESERKYRHFYEDTPFSIVLLNSNGIIVDCNPTVEFMTGYSKNDLIGKKFKDLGVIDPEFIELVKHSFQRFVKGDQVHRIDFRLRKKSGDIMWVNLQAARLKIENIGFIQAIFNDVTSQKEAEFLINQEIKKLKELDELRRNLISRVSHELKTPLVTINGGTEYLLTLFRDQLKDEMLEILELIEKGGKRLKYLIDNLIDISRLDFGKLALEKKLQNLTEIIRECSTELSFLFKERKVNLIFEQNESFFLEVDKIRIEQVITNLLTNAIKNTPPNGKILIDLKKNGKWAELSITDNGIGLSDQEKEHLFKKFGKLERSGPGYEYLDIQGSGLGLYISKEIVELHQGEVEAESEGRNKGSSFIVRLPIGSQN